MIIDDDAGMLRALEKVLIGEGASVTSASWAGDAVEILTKRDKNYDLVITDLRMPFVTGLTVVYAVHKIYPRLPVVVLTAFASPDVKAECYRQGAVAFLEKPLDSSDLLAAVEKIFSRSDTRAGSVAPAKLGNNFNCENERGESESNQLDARFSDPIRSNSGSGPRNRSGQQEKGASI